MNRTSCVLAEFYKEASWETVKFCVSQLRDQNWIPIIAHAERYEALQNRMEAIDWLREHGCLIQLNVYSLEQTQPEHSRNWARRLVAEQKADFLGTDMHGTGIRMPSITQGLLWLEETCDPEYLDALLWKNAEDKLIKNENGTCYTERWPNDGKL